jgi:molybdate transport system substrate-binding protein
MARLRRLVLAIAALCATPAAAEVVSVAVASNFLGAARALAARFEARSGAELRLSSGSTGKLYAQIANGAPYDVFLAANAREPARLEREGLAVPGSRFTYALGTLVLWSADPALLAHDGPAVLLAKQFDRLSLANPRTAPYGEAAMTVIDALGLSASLGPRIVRGENVSQAFMFAASGNVALGFVALSQVATRSPAQAGSSWVVPQDLYPSIEQQAVLLARAADSGASHQFLEYLRGGEAVALLGAYGYGRSEPAEAP